MSSFLLLKFYFVFGYFLIALDLTSSFAKPKVDRCNKKFFKEKPCD